MTRKLLWLGLGSAVYVLAAWTTQPGFYEGAPNPNPYRWVSPPATLSQGNQAPDNVTKTVTASELTSGVVIQTADAQASVFLGPAIFVTPQTGKVTVHIEPVADHPPLGQLVAETNVYRITADANLKSPFNLTLSYSNLTPSPSTIYEQTDSSAVWQALNTKSYAVIYQLNADAAQFGYFVGAIPAADFGQASAQHALGQWIPWVVAGLILLALVAGIPLSRLRRGQPARADKRPPGVRPPSSPQTRKRGRKRPTRFQQLPEAGRC